MRLPPHAASLFVSAIDRAAEPRRTVRPKRRRRLSIAEVRRAVRLGHNGSAVAQVPAPTPIISAGRSLRTGKNSPSQEELPESA